MNNTKQKRAFMLETLTEVINPIYTNTLMAVLRGRETLKLNQKVKVNLSKTKTSVRELLVRNNKLVCICEDSMFTYAEYYDDLSCNDKQNIFNVAYNTLKEMEEKEELEEKNNEETTHHITFTITF